MKANLKKAFFLACISLTLVAVFSQCEATDEFESDGKVSVKIYLTGEVNQCIPACLVIDENNPSNRYIRIDSVVTYGFGTDFVLPDSLKNCDLKIVVSGKMRESDSFKSSVAVSFTNMKDSLLLWESLYSENHLKQFNTWGRFNDTILINKQINSMSAKTLRVFPYKNRGSGTFDVDDLIVEIIRE